MIGATAESPYMARRAPRGCRTRALQAMVIPNFMGMVARMLYS
jgi:hypothetical protein